MKDNHIEILSFGGGPPSLALSILNVTGDVMPKAEEIIFADPGWENPDTYKLIPIYKKYFESNGIPFVTVQSPDGALHEYLQTHPNIPIPIYKTGGVLGQRQCTNQWKIQPIQKYLRTEHGVKTATVQLGMHYGEIWRLKESRTKWVTNRYPLIDLKLNRADCVQVIKEANLPVPPPSACEFCPLKSDGKWRDLASNRPDEFAKVVELDDYLRERNKDLPVYLHWSRTPLKNRYSSDQMPMPLDDGDEGQCESGYCFN